MLIDAKSTLAKLMATENIVVEQRKVPTACFDVKNRILTIPILNGNLSPEIYDLMIGHETGHALETPLEGWHNSVVDLKVNRTILNVCEDARIEKKIKRKFPGLRASFTKGYRQLFDMDFFGVKGKNLNYLNFIDRINLHTKGGASQGIEFSSHEQELLDDVESAETFEETVKVAIKIQKFMKEELDRQKEEMRKAKSFSKDNTFQGDIDEYDYDYGDDDEIENEELENDNGSDDYDSDEDGEGNERDYGSYPSSSTNTLRSITDEKYRQREQELYSKENKENTYCDIPKIDFEEIIIDYKILIGKIKKENEEYEYYKNGLPHILANYNKFKSESNKVVSYLVKEFEMRKNAGQQSRARISKTGDLNLNKIHEYRFTDDIFARMTRVPNGKSHGLVIFVDWSGSMNENMHGTIKQLLNLVFFCRKINIPFEVYGFSSILNIEENVDSTSFIQGKIQERNIGSLAISRFSLLNIFSSKMSNREITFMGSHLLNFPGPVNLNCYVRFPRLFNLSGTPLNEAILTSFELLPEFKRRNKLEIVNTVFLTDGNGGAIGERIESVKTNTNILYKSYKSRIWFRDPITKASIEIDSVEGLHFSHGLSEFAALQTVAFLKLLKARVGCNIIGFYMCNVRNARDGMECYMKKELIDQKIAEFRKNKHAIVSNIGYDDFYFIRSETMNIEDAEFEITETAKKTTRALVTAFSKYTNGRILNRIVLSRFITLIS
jgi:hypothetical protein